MANTYLSPAWKEAQETAFSDQTKPYELTTSIATAKKWTILRLAALGKPFKVYQLGCGVVKITTDTETCPCCKRKL